MNGLHGGGRRIGNGPPDSERGTETRHGQSAIFQSIVRDERFPCPLLEQDNGAEQILQLAVQGNRLKLSGLLRTQVIWVLSTERLWQHWRSQAGTSWQDGSSITIELPPMTPALLNQLCLMKSRLEAALQLQIDFEIQEAVGASPRHEFSHVAASGLDAETANAKERQSQLLAAVGLLVAQPQMDAGVKRALEALIEVIQREQPRSADLWHGVRGLVKKVQDDDCRGLLLEKIEACVVRDKALEPVEIRRLRDKLAGDGSWDIDTLRRLQKRHPLPSPSSGNVAGSFRKWCRGLAAESGEGREFDELLGDWQAQWKRARAESDDGKGWGFKCQWVSHVQTLAGWAADAADVKVLVSWIVAMVDVLTRAGYFRWAGALVEASLDRKFLAHVPRRCRKAFVEGMGQLLSACIAGADKARGRSKEVLSGEAVASVTKKIEDAFRYAGIESTTGGTSITPDSWRSAVESAVKTGEMTDARDLATRACSFYPNLREELETLLLSHEFA